MVAYQFCMMLAQPMCHAAQPLQFMMRPITVTPVLSVAML